MEKYKARVESIAPGVRFCAVKADTFKTARLNFTMAMPLEGDIAARALLPFLLHRSGRKYPDFSQLNARLAELYGAALSAGVSKLGEAQIMSLTINAIDDRFALDDESVALNCARLLLDLVFDPNVRDGSFLPEDMKREKRLLSEKIDSEKNNKQLYALRRCESLMCQGESYGLNPLGEKREVESLDGERVFKAWQESLKKAKIQITMAGSTDSDLVLQTLKDAFANLEREDVDIKTNFIKAPEKEEYFSEEMAVEQGKLVLGFRAGMAHEDDNREAIMLMTYLYGGSPHSKLFLNVREKMSLSYYCSSNFLKAKGLIFVQSGIDTDKEEAATRAILAQLEEIKKGQVSQEELHTSKLSIADSLRAVEDSPENIVTWYGGQLLRPSFTTPFEEIEKIEKIELEQVVEAAKKVRLDTVFMLKGSGEGETDEN